MSHKYTLTSFEKWALDIIWIHCQPGMDYLDDCPQDMLSRIFEVAKAGDRQDLCNLVEKRWLLRLKTGELQLRQALDFGEKHNMRAFLGDAYYQQVQGMKSFVPLLDASQATDFSRSNLTHEQLHNLLRGYVSLSLFWERESTRSIPRSCSNSRYHKSSMVDILLPEGRPTVGLPDFVTRLEAADGGCSCRKKHITNLVSSFSRSIPDHFLGENV
jgi:hypothetical protein